MEGEPVSRSRWLPGLAVLAVLLLIPLVLVGCSSGGGQTTTSTTASTSQASVATTTTTAGVGPTDTTGPVSTGTTGIVITLPITTSTEVATTTTEKLSSAEKKLANGHIKAMGYIDKVYVKDGKRYLSIDYAEMLSGPEAVEAAIDAGFIMPGEDLPNDYWIRNDNPQKRTFEVSDSVHITTSTRWVAGEDMNAPCTWADFKSFWGPAGSLSDSEKHLHAVPWLIERDGQTVVKIDEQYLP